MSMTFDAPPAINGDQLADELGVDRLAVYLRGRELVVDADIDRATAEQVIDAHVPDPASPTPEDRLAEVRTQAESLPQNNPVRPILLGLIDAV